ncbi:MAG: nucleotidyltransferase [Cyanobacteria bacterium K_DeepCast_35m_m2_155]|nr:nucleotidyltransferase [Cyanobacteria bacterium K_DeepCast_35m_m2_155]
MNTPPAEASDIRWKQRFDNLQRAYRRLRSMLELAAQDPESEVIRMAVIKAYEFTFELSWKTLKDYLSYNGLDARLPREVIKQAFATGLLIDGQLWIDMLEERNLMAHTYDDARAKAAVNQIQTRYLAGLAQLHTLLSSKLEETP